jgi:DNA sulfur modification protein DndB
MKLPAIRAVIGDWVYYIATMRFKDVSIHVKRVDNELHSSILLKEMLQRSITSNYKNIAHYIETQQERFFNALVLAVYDGQPKWHEVRLQYDTGEDFYDLGVLELTGDEKIFPVDGQHRVEGIKEIVSKSPEYDDEQIPVIFIGHKTDAAGMQRSRRLFSTLNRYAKPVSMRDIIALDEDDVVAIASRELIDTHPLFSQGRILDSKNKAIPETNETAFTTIITFYECNYQLLWLMVKNMDVYNANGDRVKGKSKLKEFIRHRPSDESIATFSGICHSFWNALIETFPEMQEYVNGDPDSRLYRNRDGGHILFRPIALLPFVKATIRVMDNTGSTFLEALSRFPRFLLSIDNPIWRNVLWNIETNTMIVSHKTLIEQILLYYWDQSALSEKQLNSMKLELKAIRQLVDMNDVDDLLESVAE